jgi:hypothetical protein
VHALAHAPRCSDKVCVCCCLCMFLVFDRYMNDAAPLPLDFLAFFSLAHHVPIEVYGVCGSAGQPQMALVMALQPVFEAGHVDTVFPVGGCVTLLAETTVHGHVVTRSRARLVTPGNCSWAGSFTALIKNVHFEQHRHGLCAAFVQADSPCIPRAPGSYMSPDVRCPERRCPEHCMALCQTATSAAHCLRPPLCFMRGAAPLCAGHSNGHSLASRGRRCPAQRHAVDVGLWQSGQQLPSGEWFGACAIAQPHLYDFHSANCPDNLCYPCGIYAALLGLHRCPYHVAHIGRSRSASVTAGASAGVTAMDVEPVAEVGLFNQEGYEGEHDFGFGGDFELDDSNSMHARDCAQVSMTRGTRGVCVYVLTTCTDISSHLGYAVSSRGIHSMLDILGLLIC